MIRSRPKFLLAQPDYNVLPALPVGLDISSVPVLISLGMLHIGGVQPATGAMAAAAGDFMENTPSVGELEMYERNNTRFQIISVVTSVANFRMEDGVAVGVPYAISIIPATKRDRVSEVNADYVAQIQLDEYVHAQQPCYFNYNPFAGSWSLFGPIDIGLGNTPRQGFADELGLVTEMYYLQIGYDPADIIMVDLGMGGDRARRKYFRHRAKLMFTPFKRLEARRVWGAESPIELFLLQALAKRGLSPTLQMMIFEDGSTYPSLYHLWAQNLAAIPGFITEADMYFPEQRVAVFCDSTRYHRGKRAAAKDNSVSDRLAEIGVRSVRVPGALIVRDLEVAANMVVDAL